MNREVCWPNTLFGSAKLPALNLDATQLQSKWKHAIDFGINGNYSKANAVNYAEVIANHVQIATNIIESTYHGNKVLVYLKDGLAVLTD